MSDERGTGIDLCRVCGTPTRDHPIGPCPTLRASVIYVGGPARKGENLSASALRKRKQRAAMRALRASRKPEK